MLLCFVAFYFPMRMLGILDRRLQLSVVKRALNWESENPHPYLISATTVYEALAQSLKFSLRL